MEYWIRKANKIKNGSYFKSENINKTRWWNESSPEEGQRTNCNLVTTQNPQFGTIKRSKVASIIYLSKFLRVFLNCALNQKCILRGPFTSIFCYTSPGNCHWADCSVRIIMNYGLLVWLQILRIKYMTHNDNVIKLNMLSDHLDYFTPYELYFI